jgi:hypothetical protein
MGANGYNSGNYMSNFGGTSAACPQVAGIAALILSVRPDLTQAQVRQAIESTCKKLSGYSYSNNSSHPNGTWNNQVGHGLVNAYAALQAVMPTLSGPDYVCSGTSYTVNNAPAGFTWACSNGLAKISESGNTATFSANSNYYGDLGWVSVKMGNTELARKNVQLGTPLGTITGPFDLSCYCMTTITQPGDYQFCAINIPLSTPANNILWELTQPTSVFTQSNMGQNPVFNFDETGTYTLRMMWLGECGYSSYAEREIIVPAYSFFSWSAAYPNPSSNELIIDKEEKNNTELSSTAKSNTNKIADNKGETTVLLYNNGTTKLAYTKTYPASTKQIKIDTSKLPNGVYYLNIIEKGETVKQQTIIVNH